MARTNTPSSVMYAKLKELGISNREAARILLNTSLTFDGRMLSDRIDESSQLSRRIVHTAPGEIPIGLFNNFHLSCPELERRILRKLAITRFGGDERRANENLARTLVADATPRMIEALRRHFLDDSVYRNMEAYIRHAELPDEDSRTLLYLMMFVITGCLGRPQAASILLIDYATNILGADFHTAQTVVSVAQKPSDSGVDVLIGLVRVVDGHIKAGSRMHVLNPEGTEIGLLPTGRHIVADVDQDVSRSHALVWRTDGHWYLLDLGSTNGTKVISGATGAESIVGTEPGAATELNPSDIVCLGATTRFIVMPVLGA